MGQVVVISGGGTGIGFACARHFAACGHSVVILGRRAHVLERAAEALKAECLLASPVLALSVDLSDSDHVAEARDALISRHPKIDILVNAAGGNVTMHAPADAYGGDLSGVARRWTDNFRANLLTAVLLTEALRDHLTSPGGRLIFVSSIAAYRGSGNGCYGAAKAGLHPYTFDLASALGKKGITVNTVAPGYVRSTEFFGDRMTGEREKLLISQTMVGRAGNPEDIARTIGWLSSAEASYVTGQLIQINGGAERGR